jgi:hypothetical protein
MLIKELIKLLQDPCIDPEYQIFVSNDEEGNEIKTINCIVNQELPKSNNDGTYPAIVIYPTNETKN